ncbi:MAG: hypothetical protein HYX33_03565 [Actinobacteria bacterium]|nr:hypothetical protein [Actinomycetota bacterium]
MANHLTPGEIADLTGLRIHDVIRLCRQEAVPVYQGRIDKTLFVHTMLAAGQDVSEEARATVRAA